MQDDPPGRPLPDRSARSPRTHPRAPWLRACPRPRCPLPSRTSCTAGLSSDGPRPAVAGPPGGALLRPAGATVACATPGPWHSPGSRDARENSASLTPRPLRPTEDDHIGSRLRHNRPPQTATAPSAIITFPGSNEQVTRSSLTLPFKEASWKLQADLASTRRVVSRARAECRPH